IQRPQVVTRRRISPPRRQRSRLSLWGALQQLLLELLEGRNPFLRFWRQRRNLPVFRIHDERRSPARLDIVSPGCPECVIRAGDVRWSSYLLTTIAALSLLRIVEAVSHPVDPTLTQAYGVLLVCHQFSVAVLRGSLQRNILERVPNALKIGFAP